MSSAVGIMAIKFDKMAQNRRIHFSYGHTTDSMVLYPTTPDFSSTNGVMTCR